MMTYKMVKGPTLMCSIYFSSSAFIKNLHVYLEIGKSSPSLLLMIDIAKFKIQIIICNYAQLFKFLEILSL
jgi:hypothetical protein